MYVIYKYPVPITGEFTLDLPGGAKILNVKKQAGVVCLWVWQSLGNPLVTRRFSWVSTGVPADHLVNQHYIGTIQHYGGSFVQHLFMYA